MVAHRIVHASGEHTNPHAPKPIAQPSSLKPELTPLVARWSRCVQASGADNQLTLWDLALEEDPEAQAAVKGRDDLQDIPPQLFFVHQGQTDIKELHWHSQLPGVLGSTAGDSFHLFKPANAGDGPSEQ